VKNDIKKNLYRRGKFIRDKRTSNMNYKKLSDGLIIRKEREVKEIMWKCNER